MNCTTRGGRNARCVRARDYQLQVSPYAAISKTQSVWCPVLTPICARCSDNAKQFQRSLLRFVEVEKMHEALGTPYGPRYAVSGTDVAYPATRHAMSYTNVACGAMQLVMFLPVLTQRLVICAY
eukprot:3328295-Rhodomonas_salina.2